LGNLKEEDEKGIGKMMIKYIFKECQDKDDGKLTLLFYYYFFPCDYFLALGLYIYFECFFLFSFSISFFLFFPLFKVDFFLFLSLYVLLLLVA